MKILSGYNAILVIATLSVGLFNLIQATTSDIVQEKQNATNNNNNNKRKKYLSPSSSFNEVSSSSSSTSVIKSRRMEYKNYGPYKEFHGISDNNEGFGTSVAISADGSTLATGNPTYTSTHIGLVKVYKRQGSAWAEVGNPLSGGPEDYCGHSVKLSETGDRMAFGCYGNGGTLKVFGLDSVKKLWDFSGSIDGFSTVDLSDDGTKMVIGKLSSNVVRFYDWNYETLTQVGVDVVGTEGDNLGRSCSISGDGKVVACGAREWESKRGYVDFYSFGSPVILSKLYGDIGHPQQFGHAVSLNKDGTAVAVSAPHTDELTGYVEVYTSNGLRSYWEKKGTRISGISPGGYFGYTVAMSADGDSLTTTANFAHYLKSFDFDKDKGDWTEVKHIDGGSVTNTLQWSADISSSSTVMALGESYLEEPVVRVYERARLDSNAPTSSPLPSGYDCQFETTSVNDGLRSALFKLAVLKSLAKKDE